LENGVCQNRTGLASPPSPAYRQTGVITGQGFNAMHRRWRPALGRNVCDLGRLLNEGSIFTMQMDRQIASLRPTIDNRQGMCRLCHLASAGEFNIVKSCDHRAIRIPMENKPANSACAC